MHAPASNLGRRTAPSLKKLFAVMAGFLGVSVVLAELASATTNSQPAIAENAVATPAIATQQPQTAPAEQQQPTVAAQTELAPKSLSYGVNEVVDMYRGGVKADVLLAYIGTSNYPYLLSSKEILYLNKIGVPSVVVTAMIRRDHQTQLAKADAVQPAAETAAPPVPEPAPVAYSQPTVLVVQQPVSRGHYSACSTPVCVTPNPNVTVIGSRYGSTFYNGCYYGPFSCSPVRSYYNAEFGPLCSTSYYGFGYGSRFGYGGYGGFGRYGYRHHWGRF